MKREIKRFIEKVATVTISIMLLFFALVSVPYLAELETCVRAAFVITAAYAWYAALLWANLMHPLLKKDERRERHGKAKYKAG